MEAIIIEPNPYKAIAQLWKLQSLGISAEVVPDVRSALKRWSPNSLKLVITSYADPVMTKSQFIDQSRGCVVLLPDQIQPPKSKRTGFDQVVMKVAV